MSDSRKPIRDRKVIGRSIYRIPEDGYVTPRLRQSETRDAIGFVHKFEAAEEE